MSLGLPLGRPSIMTMLSLTSASGDVLALKVVMLSPETAVGVQIGG